MVPLQSSPHNPAWSLVRRHLSFWVLFTHLRIVFPSSIQSPTKFIISLSLQLNSIPVCMYQFLHPSTSPGTLRLFPLPSYGGEHTERDWTLSVWPHVTPLGIRQGWHRRSYAMWALSTLILRWLHHFTTPLTANKVPFPTSWPASIRDLLWLG